jgi:uncharacterized protein with von Willebrand factor type A (vWA) domain
MMALIAIASFAGGAVSARLFRSETALAENVPRTIKAQAFQVIDKGGNVRATLGQAGLVLAQEDGKKRVILLLGADGEPSLTFCDEHGSRRVSLAVTHDRGSSLVLWDEKDEFRGAFGVNSEGEPSVGMVDKNGKFRIY